MIGNKISVAKMCGGLSERHAALDPKTVRARGPEIVPRSLAQDTNAPIEPLQPLYDLKIVVLGSY